MKHKIIIELTSGQTLTHNHNNDDPVDECEKYLRLIGKSEKDVAWVTFDDGGKQQGGI